MRRLTVIAITGVSTLALVAGGLSLAFRLREVPDGYLLLTKAQAEECDDGGGCVVASGRQLWATFRAFAEHAAQRQSQSGPSI